MSSLKSAASCALQICKSRQLILLAGTLLLSVMLIKAAVRVNHAYYMHHPFQGDTLSYYHFQQRVYFRGLEIGAYKSLRTEVMENTRNPAIYVTYLVLGPTKMLTLNGHLYFTLIALFSMLFSFSVCIWRRTGSWLYALTVCLLLLLFRGLYNPVYYLPSMLPDLPAAFFLGAALFSLLNSEKASRFGWLIAFSVFISIAALSRFVAAGYGLVICGPILLSFLHDVFRKRSYLGVITVLLIVGGIVLLFTGNFFQRGLLDNFKFYSRSGYAIGHGIIVPLRTTLLSFYRHFTGESIYTLGLICLGYATVFRKCFRISSLLPAVWAVAGHLILILFVLQVEDDMTQLVYIIPGLLLLVAAPFAITDEELGGPSISTLTPGILALLILLAGSAYANYSHFMLKNTGVPPSQYARDQFAFNRKAAEHAASYSSWKADAKHEMVFDFAFLYYGRTIQARSLTTFGTLIRSKFVFEIREQSFKANFGEQDTLGALVRKVEQEIDVMFMLVDPRHPKAKLVLIDAYTEKMATALLAHIKQSKSNWQFLAKLSSPWGDVVAYKNLQRYGKTPAQLKERP